ncbi:DNA polymerase III subunit delta [Metamycoplasma alkalescens]|uniref:DNA polymerase III subunit delta n=1 Tax=Metamycoplasma alkalescens TaxID=45363 RepID=UPI003D0456E8
MYLIKGDENYFIDEKINEIIKNETNNNQEEIEFIKFYDFFMLEELADAINNQGLFFNKKIIIFKNPFLFNIKNKNVNEKLINDFIELIKSFSQDQNTILIFSQEIYKYDKNFFASKAFNYIDKNSQVIQVKKIEEKNLFSFVFSMVKNLGGNISDQALIFLLEIMPNNLDLIKQEIKKLLLIEKNITKQMIEDNIFSMSNNIEFALSEAILKWQSQSQIIKKINEQIQYGFDANQIISQIASILLNTKVIAILRKKNLGNDVIAKIINIHPYRVKLHLDFFSKIDSNKLNKIIEEIATIDLNLKKGYLNDELAMNLIILKLLR